MEDGATVWCKNTEKIKSMWWSRAQEKEAKGSYFTRNALQHQVSLGNMPYTCNAGG
jgi:hypothetical protein